MNPATFAQQDRSANSEEGGQWSKDKADETNQPAGATVQALHPLGVPRLRVQPWTGLRSCFVPVVLGSRPAWLFLNVHG